MMAIIILCQKVEIALTWKQEQPVVTKDSQPVATKRKLYAGTLVLATTTMSIQPNVIPKRATMQASLTASVTLTAIITRCQKVEIALTCLSICQQHTAITTGLESAAT